MADQPLAEVFGFPINNLTAEADRYRHNRLCPFNNRSPNCTKSSRENPLGVCSVFGPKGELVTTCPVRFRQDWLIATDAAEFFFPPGTTWTSVTEVQLNDRGGKSAGNIDVVLIAYDSIGRVIDYGALEVQAIYISGNVRTPFEHYMEDPHGRAAMNWRGQPNYPRPDYLSSSRKRLAPQLIYKGGILKAWGKKQAVAVHSAFFDTLPTLPEVAEAEADMAWLVYDIAPDLSGSHYQLQHVKTVPCRYPSSWQMPTAAEAGREQDFIAHLQEKLDGVEPLDEDENE